MAGYSISAKKTDEFPEDIETILKDSANDKLPYVATWDVCLFYLEGHQHIDRDGPDRSWIIDTTNRNRTTTNKILPIFRTVTSKMSVMYPSMGVTPASRSWEDITKGLASEQALHYYWVTEDLKHKIGLEASSWLTSCGTCALHTFYDSKEKKIKTEVVSPYDLFFESKATKIEHSSFVSVRHLVHRSDLLASYPDQKEEILGIEDAKTEKYGRKLPKDNVYIHTTYWRDGRCAVSSGSIYLYKGRTPFDMMPVQTLRYTKLPHRIWGLGLIYPLIGPQDQYNEQRSQQLLFIRLNANAPWLASRQSQIGRITNKQGQKILWSGIGPEPKRMIPASLPSDVWTNMTVIEKEMQDIAGVHHVTMGRSVPAIKSGAAIEAITNKDESQLAVTTGEIEKGVANMCKVALSYMKKYYTKGLMVRMFDHYGAPMFKEIKQTDFVDVPDVIIAPGSLFAADVQQRDATLLSMFQQGLMAPERVVEELSMRTGNRFVVEKMAALSHARDILEACKVGLLVEIMPDDDLDAFKKVFGEFLRSEEYYKPKPETLAYINEQDVPWSDVQKYIRDVYVSVLTFGQPPEAYQMASAAKVFPRQEAPGKSNETLAVTGSAAAQGQMAVEQQRGAMMRQAQNVPEVQV